MRWNKFSDLLKEAQHTGGTTTCANLCWGSCWGSLRNVDPFFIIEAFRYGRLSVESRKIQMRLERVFMDIQKCYRFFLYQVAFEGGLLWHANGRCHFRRWRLFSFLAHFRRLISRGFPANSSTSGSFFPNNRKQRHNRRESTPNICSMNPSNRSICRLHSLINAFQSPDNPFTAKPKEGE